MDRAPGSTAGLRQPGRSAGRCGEIILIVSENTIHPPHRAERNTHMSTYLLFGNYSQDALKKISARRTAGAAAIIKKNGGELKSGYALLGEVDIVLIADFPDNAKAMKSSIELTRQLGIGFRTAPALSVEYFDSMMS
jgi:uncharacterized protein with GYD domain